MDQRTVKLRAKRARAYAAKIRQAAENKMRRVWWASLTPEHQTKHGWEPQAWGPNAICPDCLVDGMKHEVTPGLKDRRRAAAAHTRGDAAPATP